MINIRMQNKEVQKLAPKITVVGVGGAGGNAVNNMISSNLQGVEFLVCNTDAQALESSLCNARLQLGVSVTGGLGAGARPEIGRGAAEESLDDIMGYLDGSNMVFITAGMGGGTGTGAAPVIAKACRERGILTVGVVTKPFQFEGNLRMKMAEAGIEEMQQYVDTLIIIPNQNLFRIANERTTFAEAFRMADSVLQSGVRGVTDLMVVPGQINLDFADIRSAMLEMGKAMMGTGEATGERRAIEAAEAAINNPLLDDVTMKGARGVIINVTGGSDISLFEIDEACNHIRQEVDPDANIIFGSTFDETMEGVMRVSVVATGIDVVEQKGKKSGGGFSLNTLTAQQQRQPQLQAQTQQREVAERPFEQQAYATARTAPGAQLATQPTRPATSYRAEDDQPAVARYVQQELTIDSATAVAIEQVPAQSPQTHIAAASYEPQAPRGAVYGDAFIPPRALEAEQPARDFMAPSYTSPQASLAAARPSSEAATMSSSGLTLKPPVPGAAAQGRKRAPSLFERFTNPLRQHVAAETEDEGEGSSSAGSSRGPAPSFHARQQTLAQGSLNIDAAKTADALDDELDIPAFLRRQAN